MIAVSSFGSGGVRHDIDPATISEVVGGDKVVWVDALDPGHADFACIESELSLHPLAMEDARKHGQRPKLERYPNHAFVVAYSGGLAEVDLFVGPGWVVTVRGCGEDGQPWSPDHARQRMEQVGPREATSGHLLYVILDDLVDGYFVRADETEDRLEALEERIFADRPDAELGIHHDLYALRADLVAFRRRVQPLREVVAAIVRGEVEWVGDSATPHFQDVHDHVLRATEQLDAQRELTGNAVDAHLAIVANRTNRVMKTMTSWGAILLGSTLVAGVYGMNFRHMPELAWALGYPFALGLMAVITLVGYTAFKRRGWL